MCKKCFRLKLKSTAVFKNLGCSYVINLFDLFSLIFLELKFTKIAPTGKCFNELAYACVCEVVRPRMYISEWLE